MEKIGEEEWKKKLTPEQYRVLRQQGTEPAFCGALLHEKREGVYSCAGCGAVLFESGAKFDSKTGWPSFTRAADEKRLELVEDSSHHMKRTEVRCAKCGGHLGHVFDDGPPPAGKRYCLNSAALVFKEKRTK